MSEKERRIRWSRLHGARRWDGRRLTFLGDVLRWTMNLVFLGYVVCIGYISITNSDLLAMQPGQVPLNSVIDFERLLTIIAFAGLFVIAQFFVLGCLLYSVYHLHKKKSEEDVFSIRRWPVVLVGLGLTAVLSGMRAGQIPGIFTLILPSFGFLLGVWIASNCLRGFRTTIWLVPKFGILTIVVAGLGGIGLYFATSDKPLAFEPPRVSAEDKARLAKLIGKSESLNNDRNRMYLEERDVNLLLAAACEQLSMDCKANARMRDGAVEFDLSLGIPLGRYINFQGSYRLGIENGNVTFRPVQLRIGRLKIPTIFLGSLGDYAVTTARSDNRANSVISSIDRLRFTDQRMEAVYNSENLRRELKRLFHYHLGETPAVVDATSIHLRHLVESAADLPGGDQQFSAFLRTSFTFARERCSEGKDPVVENRAAILALAIVLGHRRMEALIGDVTDDGLKVEAEKYRGSVTLRGRRDWARHFFVSAGLALTFNSGLSNSAGLFKEEADSSEGGSGFSFPDLLADRAGTRFAVAATRDRESAKRMQELLANRFSIDDIFPPAGDLPDGIGDTTFQQEFGGVDGEKYNQVLAEIERRLTTCRALTHK